MLTRVVVKVGIDEPPSVTCHACRFIIKANLSSSLGIVYKAHKQLVGTRGTTLSVSCHFPEHTGRSVSSLLRRDTRNATTFHRRLHMTLLSPPADHDEIQA